MVKFRDDEQEFDGRFDLHFATFRRRTLFASDTCRSRDAFAGADFSVYCGAGAIGRFCGQPRRWNDSPQIRKAKEAG